MAAPETRYVKNGDVFVAYQVSGSGPVDLFYAGDWMGHLELDWEIPEQAAFLHRLGSFARLIRMDRRGQGLSDRRVPPNAIEEEIDDMRAVMDAAACLNPFVLGALEGATRAALFAATHPRRVRGLILYAGYARAALSDDYPHAPAPELMQMLMASVESTWGTVVAVSNTAPHAGREVHEAIARSARWSMGPGDALAMMRFTKELDIRAVLPSISAPTLLLHRTEDRITPIAQSRYLATAIAGARLVELPGDTSTVWIDSAPILDEIEQFVTGTRPSKPSNRSLTTVLFTDIVGSTQRAATIGDARWRDLVADHDRVMAGVVDDFGGRRVKSTGDGAVATFDGPARAVRCAVAMGIAARDLGLEIRAGLHTGEVELLDTDLAGIAVHLCARVSELAQSGQVLVTATVKDLIVGSGIELGDLGTHTLRGIPDEWRLFEVTKA